jgi:hypothetical protein
MKSEVLDFLLSFDTSSLTKFFLHFTAEAMNERIRPAKVRRTAETITEDIQKETSLPSGGACGEIKEGPIQG